MWNWFWSTVTESRFAQDGSPLGRLADAAAFLIRLRALVETMVVGMGLVVLLAMLYWLMVVKDIAIQMGR